ncbi:MAG TPA: TetR/AcrR family transcriptional regulator [Acidimicrobiales bacterium]|nr:TetR/AcrR family transcriptional regulator [Acidimicrobiales bacterium]
MIPTPAPDRTRRHELAEDAHADGRRLRAERNRDAVVQAVLSIVKEQGGGPVPGAGEVAARAGVSERTVFRHFADLDSLFLAAAAHQRPTLVKYLAPTPDDPELDKRIAAMVKLRAKLYEEIAPVRRVAVRLAATYPVMAQSLGEVYQAGRAQILAVFKPELTRAGRSKSSVLDEVDLVLSWAVWETLRSLQGASTERARKLVSELLTVVLTPYETPRPKSRKR